ncbi:hypothetical protein QUB47_01720 [Microcoleus sp. AT9_B5]
MTVFTVKLKPNSQQQSIAEGEHLIFVKTLLLAPDFFLLTLFSWLAASGLLTPISSGGLLSLRCSPQNNPTAALQYISSRRQSIAPANQELIILLANKFKVP